MPTSFDIERPGGWFQQVIPRIERDSCVEPAKSSGLLQDQASLNASKLAHDALTQRHRLSTSRSGCHLLKLAILPHG